MKNFINFMLGSTDQTEDLKKLQSLLENTGIEAKITTNTSSSGDYKASFLSIAYDDDVVRVKKKRNAGRHRRRHEHRGILRPFGRQGDRIYEGSGTDRDAAPHR